MVLKDFINNLYSKNGNYGKVVSVVTHYDHQIIENDKGQYFVDGVLIESKLSDLEEVREYINLQESANETKEKLYETITDIKIAGIIRKHNESLKVTTTLIESYISLASSKSFTTDPVLAEIRTTYKTSNLIENKIDFRLNDDKCVAINEETFEKICNLLNSSDNKEEILNYMQENVKHFMHVVKQL
jgi:predicted nuclease with TOPRIM domain